MFRTRFKNEIVAEFLPPTRPRKKQRLIILCDGMPSIPRKQPLSEFLAGKGFWVIYPRYRGAWESGGKFLAKSPHEDILDVLDELPKELEEIGFGQRFRLAPDQVFVIGGSFGGAAAILLSLDQRVRRVVANCPVVDWTILDVAERAETSKPNYADYIRQAFGMLIGSQMQTGTSSGLAPSTTLGTTDRKSMVLRCCCFMPKTIRMCRMSERSSSRRSQVRNSRPSRAAGTSAQITLSGTIGLSSKSSSIRVAFLSVNKPIRVFCYPCIPIE